MPSTSLNSVRTEIEDSLTFFVKGKAEKLNNIDEYLQPISKSLSEYILAGGKRFRPVFAYLGFLGAGGAADPKIARACAALELVHVCALIHDDLMDGSDTRRNRQSIHREFENYHDEAKYFGSSENYGASVAILLGDLSLVWSDELLFSSGIATEQLNQALPIFYDMREELMAGQYLDVLESVIGKSSKSRSSKIAQLKSGKYSIERPLQFGAALSGANPKLLDDFSKFGLALGEAFQLRDDLLGIFGEPNVTGKPSGDDIREGKRTLLIALTLDRCNEPERRLLEKSLGEKTLDNSAIAEIQELISRCGAKGECERLIAELFDQSMENLEKSDCIDEIKALLAEMAKAATQREK